MQPELKKHKWLNINTVLLPFILTAGTSMGIVLGLISTHQGIGVSPDSVRYLDAARNILIGNGIVSMGVPLTHYPPLYPIMLSITAKLIHSDPLSAAKWLQIALFGLNTCLIGVIANKITKSLFITIISLLLFLTPKTTLLLYSNAWSDALFIFFALLSFLLLIGYLRVKNYYLILIISVLLALASITRYIGISLIIPTAAVVIFYTKTSKREKAIHILTLLAVPFFTLIFLFARNIAIAHTATNRVLAYHPVTITHLAQMAYTISTWIWPFDSSVTVRVLFAVLFSITCLVVFFTNLGKLLRRTVDHGIEEFFFIYFVIFSLIYLIFILITISFFDPTTPFDYRLLAPIYTFGLILFASWLDEMLRKTIKARRLAGAILLTLAVLWIFSSSSQTYLLAGELYAQGQGYNSKMWAASNLISFLRGYTITKNTIIYTNGPELVYFLTQQKVQLLPRKPILSAEFPNPTFNQEIIDLQEDLITQKGLLVIFTDFVSQPFLAEMGDLQFSAPISLLYSDNNGLIYGVKH